MLLRNEILPDIVVVVRCDVPPLSPLPAQAVKQAARSNTISPGARRPPRLAIMHGDPATSRREPIARAHDDVKNRRGVVGMRSEPGDPAAYELDLRRRESCNGPGHRSALAGCQRADQLAK